jgi:hypothetical protein
LKRCQEKTTETEHIQILSTAQLDSAEGKSWSIVFIAENGLVTKRLGHTENIVIVAVNSPARRWKELANSGEAARS